MVSRQVEEHRLKEDNSPCLRKFSVWITVISHTNVCFQVVVKKMEGNAFSPNSHFLLTLRSKTHLSSHETDPQFLRTRCRTLKFEEETDLFLKRKIPSGNQRQPEPEPPDMPMSLRYRVHPEGPLGGHAGGLCSRGAPYVRHLCLLKICSESGRADPKC